MIFVFLIAQKLGLAFVRAETQPNIWRNSDKHSFHRSLIATVDSHTKKRFS